MCMFYKIEFDIYQITTRVNMTIDEYYQANKKRQRLTRDNKKLQGF